MAMEVSGVARLAYAQGLRAFQRISEHGQRRGSAFLLRGLEAQTDYDGYGITLTDGTVRARLLFHGRVAITTPDRKALDLFVRRVDRLLSEVGGAA